MNPNLLIRRIEGIKERYGIASFCEMDVSANQVCGRSYLVFKNGEGKVVDCIMIHDKRFNRFKFGRCKDD